MDNKTIDLEELRARSIQYATKVYLDDQKQHSKPLISIPKQDEKVQACLRLLNQPAIIYGEQPISRHERLQQHIQSLSHESLIEFSENLKSLESPMQPVSDTKSSDAFLYDHKSLFEFRKWCTKDSLIRAKIRLEEERNMKQSTMSNITKLKVERQRIYETLKNCTHVCTQIGSERPLSYVSFSPDSTLVSVTSWGGHCNTFTVPTLKQKFSNNIDTERLCCIEYHPNNHVHSNSYLLSSCNMSGNIHLFHINKNDLVNNDKFTITTLKGHLDRVSRLSFHPSGRYLASASFDTTWRLWDIEHSSLPQLLVQEGHAKQVYCIDFHIDGALVATGGLDANGIVWDIRSGRPIFTLRGHSQSVLSINFSNNGYELATGSEDNTIKIWDLRQLKNIHTIAAHKDTVTSVRFSKNMTWLLSTSHDQTSKIWGIYDWRLLSTMYHGDSSSHTGLINSSKVMHGSINTNDDYIATASYDRTIKLWKIPTE